MSDWYEEMEKAEQEHDAREYELAQEYKKGYEQGRKDAFDEIIKKIKLRKTYLEEFHPFHSFHPNNSTAIAEANTYLEIAEELKEQK